MFETIGNISSWLVVVLLLLVACCVGRAVGWFNAFNNV